MTTNIGFGFGAARVEGIAQEIQRRTKARRDYVAARTRLGVIVPEGEVNGTGLALTVQNGVERVLPFTRSSLLQLAGSLDYPARFLDRMTQGGHADLVAATLSELLVREEGGRKHLVRELDGRVDGFLSDRFKAISNDDVLSVVVQEAEKVGAEVWDLRLTDKHLHVHLIAPGLRGKVEHAMKADSPGHGWADLAEDEHHAAVTVGNSENGHGRFFGDLSLWRKACSNFAIVQKGVARVHLGSRLAEGEQEVTSDETRTLEDQVIVSKLRDVVKTAFDPVKFKKLLAKLSETTARTLGDEVGAVEAVDATIRAFGLPPERKEAILEAFLKRGKSQYWLGQALTEQSNPAHAEGLDDASRTAFDRAGGSLLALDGQGWKSFLRGAYKPAPEVEAEAHQHVRIAR